MNPSVAPQKEWLTSREVSQLMGWKPSTVRAYSSKEKWGKKTEGGSILFWHEDALRPRAGVWGSRRKGVTAQEIAPAAYTPITLDACLLPLPASRDDKPLPEAPAGMVAQVSLVTPTLYPGTDMTRAPGLVRHITFTKI